MPGEWEQDPTVRGILLLADTWAAIRDGISGVNRTLALTLSTYTGIRIYSTVFQSLDQLSDSDRREAEENHVTLISLAANGAPCRDLYKLFNEDPVSLMGDIREKVPFISHIVGHSPITAEGAMTLRDQMYPDAKVVLFYHVIPDDVSALEEALPYEIPSDASLVRLGEEADLVYSVTDKLHWYYAAKFRNRATKEVDHRLFIPQCTAPVFHISRGSDKSSDTSPTKSPTILIIAPEDDAQFSWTGIDIGACAVSKMAAAHLEGDEVRPKPKLKIGGVPLDKDEQFRRMLNEVPQPEVVETETVWYSRVEDLHEDLTQCDLCIVPSRSEPHGAVGLRALSAGIPTLIAEDSGLASLIRKLTSEPEWFLVPVTRDPGAVRQDASVWRDRIMALLLEPEVAQERAEQLRMALRRDDATKETYDNFISYCLGGVRLRHMATGFDFLYRKDEEKELPVLRSFNSFLLATLKQCWRYKHHPLTKGHDLYQILPGVDLPIAELVSHVTDKIEEKNRRIVGIEKESGAFVVYCPTLDSLTDLWAMCDVINRGLERHLLSGEDNMVLEKFRLKKSRVQTLISGPEFLEYKKYLVRNFAAVHS